MSANADDDDLAAAFAALSDPTRIGIVRALLDRCLETPEAPALGFADLRRRVGVDDSGRFRYHLEQLCGRFVEQTDGAYRLTHAGSEVAAAIVAGRYTETVSAGPTELESTCPICATDAVGRYEDGLVDVSCENDHTLFRWELPPAAAADATVEEVVDLATARVRHGIDLTRRGTCPKCYSAVEPVVREQPGGTPEHLFHVRCGGCGARVVGPVGFCLLTVPATIAFYHRHGRTVRDRYVWELDFATDDAVTRLAESEAGVVRVETSIGGETFGVTLDASASVVESTIDGENESRTIDGGGSDGETPERDPSTVD